MAISSRFLDNWNQLNYIEQVFIHFFRYFDFTACQKLNRFILSELAYYLTTLSTVQEKQINVLLRRV